MEKTLEQLSKEEKQLIIDAINNNTLFDYIASNYWKIEKDTLKELLIECIYLLNTEQFKTLKSNLKEFRDWEV